MISFKANYISSPTVEKLEYNNIYRPSKASFVEVTPVSIYDQKALDRVSALWGSADDGYASNIAEDFRDFFKQYTHNKRFFALTEQMKKFDKLDEYDILALMEVTQHTQKKYWIDYLQVSPEFDFFVPNRRIQHAGKAMLDSLKKILPDTKLYLDSVLSAVRFYEGQGFKAIGDSMTMVFKP